MYFLGVLFRPIARLTYVFSRGFVKAHSKAYICTPVLIIIFIVNQFYF